MPPAGRGAESLADDGQRAAAVFGTAPDACCQQTVDARAQNRVLDGAQRQSGESAMQSSVAAAQNLFSIRVPFVEPECARVFLLE